MNVVNRILDFFNVDLAITADVILYALAGIVLLIIALILLYRYYLNKLAERDMASEYKDVQWSSPLEAYDKYPKVNVFKWSGTFFRVGLLTALAIVLLFMSWTRYEKQQVTLDYDITLDEEILTEPPPTKEPPPPPPPPPPPVITEVPDEMVTEEEEPEFVDQTIEEETVVEEPEEAPPPPPPPPKKKAPEKIFRIVEEMPRFPGCEHLSSKAERQQCSQNKLLSFIAKNIKYPPLAQESGIEGTVVISFVVEKDGSVTDIQVVRELGGGCTEEALRVVKLMQEQYKWIPGKQRGRPVRVRFTLPIRFHLE